MESILQTKATAPTIKGVFVKSHIKAVRDARGEAGVAALQERFGASIDFKNSEDVSIADEERLILCALDVLHGDQVVPEMRDYEAGRLHFKNFSSTPLGLIIFSMFKKNFRLMMMKAKDIAGHVFRGMHFYPALLNNTAIDMTIRHCPYAINHFTGLLEAWLEFSGLKGQVVGERIGDDTIIYRIRWNE